MIEKKKSLNRRNWDDLLKYLITFMYDLYDDNDYEMKRNY